VCGVYLQASYFVFEKMKLEGFAGYDDVRLKTAIKVPKAVVGRIIGKGGKTVKEIQHNTGVIIKLPNNAADEADEHDDGVFVAVYGNFVTTQVHISSVLFELFVVELENWENYKKNYVSLNAFVCRMPMLYLAYSLLKFN